PAPPPARPTPPSRVTSRWPPRADGRMPIAWPASPTPSRASAGGSAPTSARSSAPGAGSAQPVAIAAIKRFVADQAGAAAPVEAPARRYVDRVAVVGAGPAGLTAARDLTLLGYPVTVFEAQPVAGGVLRLGVPEYRLPREVVGP